VKKHILSILFVIFFLSGIIGQNNDFNVASGQKVKYNTWLAGAKMGFMIPYCDIMDYDFFPSNTKSYQFGWSVFGNKQISPFVGLQAQFTSGKLYAEKSNRHFESSFIQYGINGYLSITDLVFTNVQKKRVNLYFLLGIGLMDFRSVLYENDVPVSDEGYSDLYTLEKNKATSEFVVPVAIGANFNISKLIDLNIETSLNSLVGSDKLDCTKELRNDKYGYTSIGLSFKIGDGKNRHLAWISTKEKQEFEEKLAKKNKSEIELLSEDRDFLASKVAYLDSIINANNLAEKDDDNDGVPNSRDLEPDTPSGELVNFQGIAIIQPEKIVQTDTIIDKDRELLFSIYFEFNSSEIQTKDNMKIAEAAKKLNENLYYKIEIRGHTDEKGSEAYNKELSKRRSQAVFDKLVKDFRINPERLIQSFRGKDDPLSTKDDYINRRVDFVIHK
jgi:OOP family OmpA-OmpF porin